MWGCSEDGSPVKNGGLYISEACCFKSFTKIYEPPVLFTACSDGEGIAAWLMENVDRNSEDEKKGILKRLCFRRSENEFGIIYVIKNLFLNINNM
jgi:hypothetical protein